MNKPTDIELLKGAIEEMRKLDEQMISVDLTLGSVVAMSVIGALQLACRHPGFTGPSRQTVKDLIEIMRDHFSQHNVPYILELIRRGDTNDASNAQTGPISAGGKGSGYKLPKCWLGKTQTVISDDEQKQDRIITAGEVNLDCQCANEMQAFFCATGHMTDCHYPLTCKEAECSHLARYELESFDGEDDCS